MRHGIVGGFLICLWACGSAVSVKAPAKDAAAPEKKQVGVGPTEIPANVVAPYTPTAPLPGAVHVNFRIPRQETPAFDELPWPSELLRRANGKIDLSSFPERQRLLLDRYLALLESDVDGFSVAPAIFFHFSGRPKVDNFPEQPGDTMAVRSPVFLIDVDPASPERGSFRPLEFRFFEAKTAYLASNAVAVKPLAGNVLRPGTLYAAVVRRDLNDESGAPLGTSTDLELTKWTDPRGDVAEERARLAHVATYDYLASLDVKREDIAAVAVFRTQNPQAVHEKLFEVVTHLGGALAPRIIEAKWRDDLDTPLYWVIEGHYCTPNFQSHIENAPFGAQEGGSIELDTLGVPKLVPIPASYTPYYNAACDQLMLARFMLSVPKSVMPAAGWPLLESAHGTGGSATTFLGDNDFAGWAAGIGMAVVSTDQPLHGDSGDGTLANPGDPGARPGSRVKNPPLAIPGLPPLSMPGLTSAELFYNPVNPAAGRDNARQAAVDAVVLGRLILATDFSQGSLLPATHARPRFDSSRLVAAGHSQGSQTNAAYAALDPLVRGVLLSGCGGDLRYGILRRTQPAITQQIPTLLSSLLGMGTGELDEFHPVMALAQWLADPVDPQSWATHYREPLAGRHPQNVLHYEGIRDSYNPYQTAEAMAVALRATQLEPLLQFIPSYSVLGLPIEAGPIQGNVANGAATIALVQFDSTQGEDGHFVLYHEPGAAELAVQFFESVLEGGAAAIGPVR